MAGPADRRPNLPKVVRCAAGCLYTALHGHSRSGGLRTRFTDFPHSVDMDTWMNQIAEYALPFDAGSVMSERYRTTGSGLPAAAKSASVPSMEDLMTRTLAV